MIKSVGFSEGQHGLDQGLDTFCTDFNTVLEKVMG
jgi:hypothetical protein